VEGRVGGWDEGAWGEEVDIVRVCGVVCGVG